MIEMGPPGQEKPRCDCLGQVHFPLGQVKIEVQWPGGKVKLASVVL